MNKIVITGGAGFIGSHIAEYWNEKGAEVHVVDNLRTGFVENLSSFTHVVIHKASIMEYDVLMRVFENADYIYHLAAMVSVPESIEKPKECIELNTIGTLQILEAARHQGVKKIVFSSSCAIYGDNPESPKKETTLPIPKNPYAFTKLNGEHLMNFYYETFGLQTVSLRYFNVYGPRQNPNGTYAAVIPFFINNALHGNDLIIHGSGEQNRDFVFVKDIVQANIDTSLSNVTGIFNVASGYSTSIKQLAEMIKELTRSRSTIIHSSARIGDIVYSESDISAIKNQLKFQPQYSLEQGLEMTIRFFRNATKKN
ncbi:NAD-dependent epimerase/dehydratase family protein [bacterium]|nr:NAD-dependent epimerase/dehydratase family protein [bacterium]